MTSPGRLEEAGGGPCPLPAPCSTTPAALLSRWPRLCPGRWWLGDAHRSWGSGQATLDIWGLAVRVRALQAVLTEAASKDKEGLRATTGIWSHPQASALCVWLGPKLAITAAATKKTGPGTVLSATQT